jgi:hypothetical protein
MAELMWMENFGALECDTMMKFNFDLTPAPLLEERVKFGESLGL